jgi:hypothetical protein
MTRSMSFRRRWELEDFSDTMYLLSAVLYFPAFV